MTKITLTLAAALLAGTTLTSAANAGGIRVGFGFPLGSFIAHSAQNAMEDSYNHRRYERRRRAYRAEAPVVRKAKPQRKVIAAKPITRPISRPAVKTAKLEDKLASNPETTTEIAKTSDVTTASTTPAETTPATTVADTATTSTSDTRKVATETKATPADKSAVKKIAAEAKQICRRYSAAIAGLVDVPCND